MKVIEYLSTLFSIDPKYMILIIKSIVTLLLLDVIKQVSIILIKKIKDNKREYNFTKNLRSIIAILKVLFIILIWSQYLSKFLTFITLISAAFTIALRDLIFNFFSGIYIRIAKPFSLEDRIEINNYKGDVININTLNFEVLEVNNENFLGQSTGVITHIPNSNIFNYPLRNYNKGFKYIWNVLSVKVPLTYDTDKAKKTLTKIVKANPVIKDIPKKLKHQINDLASNYRIYYNNIDPVVYMEIQDDYVLYTIRYLIHPKKAKEVSSNLWQEVIKAYQNKEIDIYKD